MVPCMNLNFLSSSTNNFQFIHTNCETWVWMIQYVPHVFVPKHQGLSIAANQTSSSSFSTKIFFFPKQKHEKLTKKINHEKVTKNTNSSTQKPRFFPSSCRSFPSAAQASLLFASKKPRSWRRVMSPQLSKK